MPALGVTSSQVAAGNLNAMHAARQAIIQNAFIGKVKHALTHKIKLKEMIHTPQETWCFIKEKIVNSGMT